MSGRRTSRRSGAKDPKAKLTEDPAAAATAEDLGRGRRSREAPKWRKMDMEDPATPRKSPKKSKSPKRSTSPKSPTKIKDPDTTLPVTDQSQVEDSTKLDDAIAREEALAALATLAAAQETDPTQAPKTPNAQGDPGLLQDDTAPPPTEVSTSSDEPLAPSRLASVADKEDDISTDSVASTEGADGPAGDKHERLKVPEAAAIEPDLLQKAVEEIQEPEKVTVKLEQNKEDTVMSADVTELPLPVEEVEREPPSAAGLSTIIELGKGTEGRCGDCQGCAKEPCQECSACKCQEFENCIDCYCSVQESGREQRATIRLLYIRSLGGEVNEDTGAITFGGGKIKQPLSGSGGDKGPVVTIRQDDPVTTIQSDGTVVKQRKTNYVYGAKASAAKSRRCGECEGCMRDDCGQCPACLDKPKFGGRGTKKRACDKRVCRMKACGGYGTTIKTEPSADLDLVMTTVVETENQQQNEQIDQRIGQQETNVVESNVAGGHPVKRKMPVDDLEFDFDAHPPPAKKLAA